VKQWFDNVSAIVITFWVGGLWVTGFWAYVLFKNVPDQKLAGQVATEYFHIMSTFGLYAACFLLLLRFFKNGFQALNQVYFWTIIAMLSLVLANQYGIEPQLELVRKSALPLDVMQSPYADSFKMWHGVASVVYMVQCVFGLIVVTKRLSN
jgi:hypothetical protein